MYAAASAPRSVNGLPLSGERCSSAGSRICASESEVPEHSPKTHARVGREQGRANIQNASADKFVELGREIEDCLELVDGRQVLLLGAKFAVSCMLVAKSAHTDERVLMRGRKKFNGLVKKRCRVGKGVDVAKLAAKTLNVLSLDEGVPMLFEASHDAVNRIALPPFG